MHALERWRPRLAAYLPEFLAAEPILCEVAPEAAVVMHGSTTFGVDDEWSDLDVWLLLPEARLRAIDARSGTRFFEFEVDGKIGHCNVESRTDFAERVRRCDLPLISELRSASVLSDPGGEATALTESASRAMREEVRLAWFQHHFVEFSSERKATQTPTYRGEPLPVLHFTTLALAHALRAALVLDREPYPYAKWLPRAARATVTGATIERAASALVERLGEDALRRGARSEEHPLRAGLGLIRDQLRDAARAEGIEGPWLDAWWLHIHPSRAGVRAVEW